MPQPQDRPPLGRVATRLLWGRNPMCRPADRIEWRILVVLVVVGLLAVPFAAALGTATQDSSSQSAAAYASTNHRVLATLTRNAPDVPPASSAATLPTKPMVQASWTGPDNAEHTGPVPAAYGAEKGSQVPIWTNDSGERVSPPRSESESTTLAVIAAILALVGLETGLALLYSGLRHLLNRNRFASWETEWAQVEPTWRKQNLG